jgi:hypothetical protein
MPSRSLRIAGVLAAAFTCMGGARAQAQRPQVAGAHVISRSESSDDAPLPAHPSSMLLSSDGEGMRTHPAPSWAPVASLVLPGAGQAALRQTRGVAYLAAEAYAWVQAIEYRREANRRRADYHRTAREVARAPFGATRDTSWAYYETLEERIESGRYSLTPGSVTPETDTSTYNGLVWFHARALYWDPNTPLPPSDPRYQKALAEYEARAVKPDFAWSWRDQQLQWDIYKADIARENQLSRDLTVTLVVIGANHLVSAIDALASVRLRQSRGPSGESRIEATVPWPALGHRPRRH